MLNIDHWSWIIWSGFALCGFLVKTTGLTYLRHAFKDGKKLAGGAFVVVMVLAVLQSASFELTFYGTNYGDAQARRQQKKDVGTDIAKEIRDLEAKLETRSTKRTPAEVEQAIKLALAKKIEDSTLARMTANCSIATSWAYTLCPPVFALRTELKAARGYAQNEADLKSAREGRTTLTAVHDAHPGVAVIARFLDSIKGHGWADNRLILDALIFISLLLVQLCSICCDSICRPATSPRKSSARSPRVRQSRSSSSQQDRLARSSSSTTCQQLRLSSSTRPQQARLLRSTRLKRS